MDVCGPGGNGDGTGTLTSESDSQYTEGGAIRYHVITMRPRLGSDGGRSVSNIKLLTTFTSDFVDFLGQEIVLSK